MSPQPKGPGLGSTLIDLGLVFLVLLILGCFGLLLWTAIQVVSRGVARLRRPRRWPSRRRNR